MKRISLESTAVASAGYDADTQELEIEFRNGRVYRYRAVPRGVYDFLIRSPSKGGFVNRMIEGRYEYQDVSEPAPPIVEQDLFAALQASIAARSNEQE